MVMAPLGSTTSFMPVEQQAHRATQRRVVDENDVVDVALVMRERDVADLDGEETVGEPARMLELAPDYPLRAPGSAWALPTARRRSRARSGGSA